jgi:hypothetical protein
MLFDVGGGDCARCVASELLKLSFFLGTLASAKSEEVLAPIV